MLIISMSLSTEIIQRCRDLRKGQTEAETIMWKHLRNRAFLDIKFSRQYPVKFFFEKRVNYFIADFCCQDKKLIIEVDGPMHDQQKEYDKMREDVLRGMGFSIIRFTNSEVEIDIEYVLKCLQGFL